jgi:DNA recombination protein RmuC
MTEMIIVSVVCVALGVLVGVLFTRGQKQGLMAQLQVLNSQVEDAKNAVETAKAETANRIKEVKEDAEKHLQDVLAEKDKAYQETLLAKDKAAKDLFDAQERSHSEAIKAQQERIEETMAKVSEQMKTATDQMLKQRQKEFTDASNTNLGQIVNPLKDTIANLKETMEKSSKEQTSLSGEMKESIANMLRQSEAAKQSADELTRVFKHGSKVQGDWGETVLDELLQAQGLTQGVQYDVQTYIRDAQGNIIKSDDGAMMRPDIILHLDQRREVVIDSKVSLTAFMDYVNADTDEKRDQALKAHIDSIVKHVKELSTKDYSSYIQPPKVKMDYVIMFVPNTGALWTALNTQPDLWRKAMEKNVYIADEQTLYAALRIIKLTWTQIEQAQNHQKVYALADEIMDRVGQFVKHYQNIGKALDNAKKAYDDGEKKLQPQGQSILQSCGKMQKLGAKQSTKNPLPQLVDIDDIPALGAEFVEEE